MAPRMRIRATGRTAAAKVIMMAAAERAPKDVPGDSIVTW
jgi:hypothetical protein